MDTDSWTNYDQTFYQIICTKSFPLLFDTPTGYNPQKEQEEIGTDIIIFFFVIKTCLLEEIFNLEALTMGEAQLH